jgi:hypothetical protein
MLSKCANPACLARFHYLHEGKIFKIERAIVVPNPTHAPTRRIEHFWLCKCCAQTLTVVLENGVVTACPLRQELSEGTPEEKSERKRDVA